MMKCLFIASSTPPILSRTWQATQLKTAIVRAIDSFSVAGFVGAFALIVATSDAFCCVLRPKKGMPFAGSFARQPPSVFSFASGVAGFAFSASFPVWQLAQPSDAKSDFPLAISLASSG
ncbi:MAG: hypothetical protein U0744_14810 [Gemmataceae bacterium]